MNKLNILSLLLGLALASKKKGCDNCFNILSLDGARYNGLMTAKFVAFMEEKAYNVAKRELPNDKCFKQNV